VVAVESRRPEQQWPPHLARLAAVVVAGLRRHYEREAVRLEREREEQPGMMNEAPRGPGAMRAAILARVSDERQVGEGQMSLANQLAALQGFVASRGWLVVRVFELPGESAYVDDLRLRPLFAGVVEAAERREFDVLVVRDFTRFARSLRVGFDVLWRFQRAGVRLLDLTGTDYTEDEDRAVPRSVAETP
jgi:hypothetical protein